MSQIGEKSAQATIPEIKETGHQSLVANKEIPADKLYFLVQEKQKEIILLSVPQLSFSHFCCTGFTTYKVKIGPEVRCE